MTMRPLATCLFVAVAVAIGSACGSHSSPTPSSWALDDLAHTDGFTLHTPDFDVPAGTEVQDCYFVDVPDINAGADVWIGRTVIGVNPGSHHVNLFRVRTIVALDPAKGDPVKLGTLDATVVRSGECFKSGNWSDWPLVVNSQSSTAEAPPTDWQLPTGVAYRFHPGEKLMLQVHYVNATTQKTPSTGRVAINLYKSPDAAPEELGTLFASQQSIRVCASNPTPSFSGGCRFNPGTFHIAAVNGHFHSRGTRFRVFTWDGRSAGEPNASDEIYESTRWDDPPMTRGLDVVPPVNGGIRWTCEYQWRQPEVGCDALNAADKSPNKDCCYTFGPHVDVNEHCNVFVYYWPKVGQDVSCN
jgi:hypothetical protein